MATTVNCYDPVISPSLHAICTRLLTVCTSRDLETTWVSTNGRMITYTIFHFYKGGADGKMRRSLGIVMESSLGLQDIFSSETGKCTTVHVIYCIWLRKEEKNTRFFSFA